MCLLKYQEAKKLWEESLTAERFKKIEVDDKKVEKIVTEIKKKKAMKKKWSINGFWFYQVLAENVTTSQFSIDTTNSKVSCCPMALTGIFSPT